MMSARAWFYPVWRERKHGRAGLACIEFLLVDGYWHVANDRFNKVAALCRTSRTSRVVSAKRVGQKPVGTGCDLPQDSQGCPHLTAIRNALPPCCFSNRKTSPSPWMGRASRKRRLTSIFDPTGIRTSLRSRAKWVLIFSVADSTSPAAPWTLTKTGCWIGYLRSLRRSFGNVDESP